MTADILSPDIHFDATAGLGRILLDRPKAMNALTLEQVRAMMPRLERWAVDPAVRAVVIKGAGERAFCAGGDVRSIYDARQRGDFAFLATFYREEYVLNRLIKTLPKPYIALWDGVVMGGGVGISVHGSHRVATEHALFAMPETGIGLFPDVGGGYFLPRAPGCLGVYLGLTGARIRAADCLYAGIATHCVPRSRLGALEQALADAAGDGAASLTDALDSHHEDPGEPPLAAHREVIDRCFGQLSVEEILAALAAEATPWAEETRRTLLAKSPTSLKVTLRQMRLGAGSDFDQVMTMEYRLSQRFMHGRDFFEGVRAVVIDKDNAPRWQPAALTEIDPATVDGYFKPLEQGDELTFPQGG